MNISGVYEIRNLKNNKVYIGSAISIYKRIGNHKNALRRNSHCNIKLQRAWLKYGEDNFLFSIKDISSDKKELVAREQYFIDLYDSVKNGYNIAPNAYSSLGRKATKETKDKLSAASKGRKWSKERVEKLTGLKRNQETKDKISKALKGKLAGKPWSYKRRLIYDLKYPKQDKTNNKLKFDENGKKIVSAETRLKLSLAGKGRIFTEQQKERISLALKGKKKKPLCDEHKKKLSDSLTGRTKPARTEEHCRKISESKKGKKSYARTPESISKMLESRRNNCIAKGKSMNGRFVKSSI